MQTPDSSASETPLTLNDTSVKTTVHSTGATGVTTGITAGVKFDNGREQLSIVQPSEDSQIWESAKDCLKEFLDTQLFSAYIAPLGFVSHSAETGELVLASPTRFLSNHLERSLSAKVSKILQDRLDLPKLKLRFVVDSSLAQNSVATEPYVVVKRPAAAVPKRVDAPAEGFSEGFRDGGSGRDSSGLNPRYTFDSFVVGRCNEFCHAAALRIAEKPGLSYNPFFIYGGVGLGKTHLAHAIGNSLRGSNPRAKILYLSSETFTNELILSLRSDKMDEFKKRLRNADLLIIDDIQFMSGKERTQEEFFHTFNALYSAKKQIVITSDKMPQEIRGLEARLHSRFSWGLTADLQSPDYETRVAILKHKAALESLQLPEDVVTLISEKISSNVRELEGALTRLFAVSSLRNTGISLELAKAALKPFLQERVSQLSIDDIKKAVATHFSIKVSDLVSKRRTKNLSFPRHIAMYLCRKHTSTSYPEIGNQFGGRDHSSVIHGANVISLKVATDDQIRVLVESVERQLVGTLN